MRKFTAVLFIGLTALLASCGGGGGSPGASNLPYTITLRADKTLLPLNVTNSGSSGAIGANAPYTTTLYVEAREGAAAAPVGDKAFACNLVQGLDYGALYYLDGKPEHMDTTVTPPRPSAYRAIVLDANSGAASFHFHASNTAGTARIVCSVTNPNDKNVYSASVDIVVGGVVTNMPASVQAVAQAPGYLGVQDTTDRNLRNNVALQTFIKDDVNQPVPNPAANNLRVRLLPSNAYTGSRLVAGAQSGDVLYLNTVGGIATFSVASGLSTGPLLMELTTDRRDNDITNGIQDPIVSYTAVSVVKAIASAPLAVVLPDLAITNSIPFVQALEATGGIPPYTWSAAGLPTGLKMDGSGIISGTTSLTPGAYTAVVTVTDSVGATVTKQLKIAITGDLPPPPPPPPPVPTQLEIAGCSGSINTACAVPSVVEGSAYSYIFTSTGGDEAVPVVSWSAVGVPAGLTFTYGAATTGKTAVLSGTIPAAAAAAPCPKYTFTVTAQRGTMSITRLMSIQVTPGTGNNKCTLP